MNLDFTSANVLVVGDVMLDSYWEGATERISPEAPVPVVKVHGQSSRIGGAGNVALNVTALGGRASLFALMGGDQAGTELGGLIDSSKVNNLCVVDAHLKTITKLRVLSQHQQLMRLDFEDPGQSVDISALFDSFEQSVSESNVVVLSDYNKGMLNDAQPFIVMANQHSVPVLIDPKKSDFENYRGAFLLTPNTKEFETVAGPWHSQADLLSKAKNLIREHQLNGLLVTQGAKGMTLVTKDDVAEHFPAHAKDVYDVTGAGDTVIAAVAAGLGSGMSIQESVSIACKAAGIVVGRVGTASVSVDDLLKDDDHENSETGVIDGKVVEESFLVDRVSQLKKQGKRIIFTNGCFDLLHAGHVRYLERAAELGDVLVVAVNSDLSVKKLKGTDRPVNPLTDRMDILAALSSVDYVVSFTEDTPERLVCSLKPDILVKGGDYSVDQIAGRHCAGKVELIDLVAGRSTSAMMRKISDRDN